MNHFAIPETNVQHCTLTIFQLKNGFKRLSIYSGNFWVVGTKQSLSLSERSNSISVELRCDVGLSSYSSW